MKQEATGGREAVRQGVGDQRSQGVIGRKWAVSEEQWERVIASLGWGNRGRELSFYSFPDLVWFCNKNRRLCR